MNSKVKKHILFLTRWYPSDSDPMLGLFVRNHASAAVNAGYEVSVAYVSPSGEDMDGTYRETRVVSGDLTEIIVYYKRNTFFKPLFQALAWIKAIRMVFNTKEIPDLIHAHVLTRTGLMAFILSRWYKVPYIVTEHWSRYYDENPGYKGVLRKLITRLVIKKASAVTVVSKRLYNAMLSKGLSFPLEILPNVVDEDIFNINENRNTAFRFISISCFEEKSKNLKMIIDSASTLMTNNNDFQVVFVGDGLDKQLIEDYAKEKEVSAIFTGTLTPEGTASLLGQSHCLILSSNYETFGLVAYEAMLSGLPVITTDVADLRDVIDTNIGIVVPVNNSTALTEAMRSVMKNYSQFHPLEIRESVINICSRTSVSEKLNKLYQRIIV